MRMGMVSSRYLVHWFSCRAIVKSRSQDSCTDEDILGEEMFSLTSLLIYENKHTKIMFFLSDIQSKDTDF